MFLFGRKPQSPLQVYGKWPIAKDYLRIGCGNGTARDLRDWADRTFSGVTSVAPLPLAGSMRFLAVGTGDPILGVVWPSSDAGGLRLFPFFALVERNPKELQKDWRQGMESCRATWASLEALEQRLNAFEDAASMLDALRGRPVEPTESAASGDEGLAWPTWLADTFGDDGEHELAHRFDALRELARAHFAGPVRLPLGRREPFVTQVQAWWTLLREEGWWQNVPVPTTFFHTDSCDDRHTPFVVFAPTLIEDVRWLSPPGSEGTLGASDLCRFRSETRSQGATGRDRGITLLDALRSATRRTREQR